MNYNYKLIRQVDSTLNLLEFEEKLIQVVVKYGGKNVRVHKRGYSFESNLLSNNQKRKLGRKIAKYTGLGRYVVTYHYTKSDGIPATSHQLFRKA